MDSQLPNPGLGTLSLLPLEIRDMIYGFMLAADPAIRRVSKAIHHETESMVSQHGICRINVHYDRTATWGLPIAYFTDGHWHSADKQLSFRPQISPTTLAMVQSLKVHVDMVEPYEASPPRPYGPSFSEIIQHLVSPMVTRKHCHLVFTLAKAYEICPPYEPQIATSFGFIHGFDLVTIELRKRPWVRGNSDFHDWRKRIVLDDAYTIGVLKEQLLKCGLVRKSGAGSRVKIIRVDVGANDEEVLWDSDDDKKGELHVEDPMEE